MIDHLFHMCLGFLFGSLVLMIGLSRNEPIMRLLQAEGENTPSTFRVDCAAKPGGDVRCHIRRLSVNRSVP